MSAELHRKFFRKFLKAEPPPKGTFLKITGKKRDIIFCIYDDYVYINGEMFKWHKNRPGLNMIFFDQIKSVAIAQVEDVIDTLNTMAQVFENMPMLFK